MVLACANGRVGFMSRVIGVGQGEWVCMNDGTRFAWPHDDIAGAVVVLDQMLAKAVGLKGAVQQVFTIPAL